MIFVSLALQDVGCVEILTIFSIWYHIMEKGCIWGISVSGAWGFLGGNTRGPLILYFPATSTDEKWCLSASALDSRDAGLEFPPSGVEIMTLGKRIE